MATLTATAAQSTVPAKYAINGVITRVVDYSLGATGNPNLSTGDVIQMLRVPNGAIVTDVWFVTDQLSGGNYTVTVGDGNDADRYFASLSTGSTSGINKMTLVGTGLGYSYSAEDTIDITASTVTTATASGVLRLVVSYIIDNA
jgi:hypothetical protein